MVEITREGLFTLDSTIVHKAVFQCLPYTHTPLYRFLGVIYMFVWLPTCLPAACLSVRLSVRPSVFLMWWREHTIVILQCYMCTFLFFYIDLNCIFGPFTSSFVFCLFCFKFCLQKGFFPLLSFAFCVLTFSFLLLSFVFKLLYIVFWLWVSHGSSMIKGHLSTPSNFSS